ncbi:ubiquitin related modifier 1, partial [Rozella allomycis CSF55]
SGGLETLFSNQRNINLTVPSNTSIAELLTILKTDHLTGKPELFLSGNTVRPGILVLINNCDWELEGEAKYIIQPKDSIVFISTLHGG